jgi:hypothetical protein
MKKSLLFCTLILLTACVFGQNTQVKSSFKQTLKPHFFRTIPMDPPGTKNPVYPQNHFQQNSVQQPNAVTIIDLGQSANAYGFYGGNRTYIWADNDVNAVSFVHRMVADGGYGGHRIAYDISQNGGESWKNNIRIYEPIGPGGTYPLAAGRYPQGGIYNPSGNMTPGNAFFTYFIPTLDGSNGDTWGGYAYGVHKLDSTLAYTQHNLSAHDAFKQNVPDAFTILPNGSFFAADPAVTGGIASNYNDSMILSKGSFNAVSHDFEVTQSLFYLPVDKYISDTKIAFAPDGNTGFLSVLSHHDYTFETDSVFYPILYKTTDAGNTWSAPIFVKLWGPDGLDGIKNWLTDSMLGAFFEPPVPARDEVSYTTAWEHDLVVDMNGNPHICVVIGISGGAWNIYTPRDYIAVFDIYSTDGGTSWLALPLDSLKTFDGLFGGTGGITEYNRVQISRTQDGSKLFYSWLDTETDGITDNVEPNIYCKGFSVPTSKTTKTFNVTKFTPAYAQAFMGSQSHMVFSQGGTYTIPFVYQEMSPVAPADPVQYKYIHNFKILDADFVGIDQIETSGFIVSEAWPNPANNSVSFELNLTKSMPCRFTVYSLPGQEIFRSSPKTLATGSTSVNIDVSAWKSGVYFVSFTLGSNTQTKKIIVR